MLVDGAPPLDWNDTLNRDSTVSGVGEEITLSTCADTSGNVSSA
ncbi:MAG TPA: hypothetical protein VHG90_15285 [Acidimicrobiales bacterium]|nr:hypothetical protein [Acidimicrobiales bacterium]